MSSENLGRGGLLLPKAFGSYYRYRRARMTRISASEWSTFVLRLFAAVFSFRSRGLILWSGPAPPASPAQAPSDCELSEACGERSEPL